MWQHDNRLSNIDNLQHTPLKCRRGDVHVWRIWLDDMDPSVFRPVLSSEETERADRFAFAVDAKRYINARGCLRHILARYAGGVYADEVLLAVDAYGKPFIVSGELSFNLSQRNGAMMLALAYGGAVGVDVEYPHPMDDLEAMARIALSPVEREAFETRPPGQRMADFFRIWVRKEAILKAIGVGLSCAPDRLTVSAPSEPATILAMPDAFTSASTWTLIDIDPAPDFIGALARPGQVDAVHFWSLGWP